MIMNTILVPSIVTILLLFYCEALCAEYSLNHEGLLGHRNNKYNWEKRPLLPFDILPPRPWVASNKERQYRNGDVVRDNPNDLLLTTAMLPPKMQPPKKFYTSKVSTHKRRGAIPNDVFYDDTVDYQEPEIEESTVRKNTVLRKVTKNLISLIGIVLEEMINHFNERMTHSRKSSRASSKDPENDENESDDQEPFEINYEDALIEEEPEWSMDDSWLNEMEDLRGIEKINEINSVTFPEDYEIFSKLKNKNPNIFIDNYDQGFPDPR